MEIIIIVVSRLKTKCKNYHKTSLPTHVCFMHRYLSPSWRTSLLDSGNNHNNNNNNNDDDDDVN